MKSKKLVLILSLSFFAALSIFSSPTIAVEDEEEAYPTVSKKKNLDEIIGDVIPTLVNKKIGRLEIDITGSEVVGYDANINLNRYDEDGSMFMQQTLGMYGKYPIADSIYTLRGSYDLTWIKYFKFSDPDLLNNILGVGVDAKIADDFVWSVDYTADFVGFPHDELSEYTMNQIETSLRHDITDWLYQKIAYQFFYKHYPKLKTRNNRGSYRLGDREDTRNTLIHRLGLYLADKTFIKTENKLYYNDSTEQYLDYYDYKAFKTEATIVQLITKKLYETVNFAYQYKSYDKRGVSDNVRDQRDHLFILGGSIFYDVIPSVSVGVNFDCRKNYSYENAESYEDYIISSGVYCSF